MGVLVKNSAAALATKKNTKKLLSKHWHTLAQIYTRVQIHKATLNKPTPPHTHTHREIQWRANRNPKNIKKNF